ncbi:MAG: hypothetical protein AAGA54_16285 [Myxococcota bacterium]
MLRRTALTVLLLTVACDSASSKDTPAAADGAKEGATQSDAPPRPPTDRDLRPDEYCLAFATAFCDAGTFDQDGCRARLSKVLDASGVDPLQCGAAAADLQAALATVGRGMGGITRSLVLEDFAKTGVAADKQASFEPFFRKSPGGSIPREPMDYSLATVKAKLAAAEAGALNLDALEDENAPAIWVGTVPEPG